MPEICVYYHDPIEVDPATSWTGLAKSLRTAKYLDVTKTNKQSIFDLFAYARPDAVVEVDGRPLISIEQTQMNPSGHNIPQRFSFQVRAAELNVPSILYYPEYSRRTFSDPNPRYLQIRVPLAQRRLTQLYHTPALSLFWPTDKVTLLPSTNQKDHTELATLVDDLVACAQAGVNPVHSQEVAKALTKMTSVATAHERSYRSNKSVRRFLPSGFSTSATMSGKRIDPPNAARLWATAEYLHSLTAKAKTTGFWPSMAANLKRRDLTLVFTGTANAAKSDSEHPWPGYLTLLDVLYCRSGGRLPHSRDINLVYALPIASSTYVARANRPSPPTPTYIVDRFADMIVLADGVVAGQSLRGSNPASVVLFR